ncbi:hypothetical protein PoB_007159800 [Plakobranchus ocellatus]|uniref:Uncharacterized protein n=1 Tax=Plakobranchus ocellatus TaxID=259542 RepID=A0AAV4DLE2_9GAST|nr:hypothetical protein PoB_007159800 [Plakobranchus ocellatus]
MGVSPILKLVCHNKCLRVAKLGKFNCLGPLSSLANGCLSNIEISVHVLILSSGEALRKWNCYSDGEDEGRMLELICKRAAERSRESGAATVMERMKEGCWNSSATEQRRGAEKAELL